MDTRYRQQTLAKMGGGGTTYNMYFALRTTKMVFTTDHQHVIKESCG